MRQKPKHWRQVSSRRTQARVKILFKPSVVRPPKRPTPIWTWSTFCRKTRTSSRHLRSRTLRILIAAATTCQPPVTIRAWQRIVCDAHAPVIQKTLWSHRLSKRQRKQNRSQLLGCPKNYPINLSQRWSHKLNSVLTRNCRWINLK